MQSVTATEIAEKAGISRSTLYRWANEDKIEVSQTSSGRYQWTKDTLTAVSKKVSLKEESNAEKNKTEKEKYPELEIQNRRYLGNKFKLSEFIKNVIDENCRNINTIADVFAGTGAFAYLYTDKKLIINDLLYSNYIIFQAWFSSESYSKSKIEKHIIRFNEIQTQENNYMRKNFANTYYSADTCSKIGKIREEIEFLYKKEKVNDKEYAILITSLLYGMDRIANTVGHYDAFRKGAEFDRKLILPFIFPEDKMNINNKIYNIDANDLVKKISVDLLYLDPPYNSRQYSDAYHLLENVALWDKPEVYGVARKMDRTHIKSEYCLQTATEAFEDLIENSQARYILLSYNNMAQKGNSRSNAKIADKDIIRILEKKGKVSVFSEEHRAFTTGQSEIAGNEERLFLCEVYPKEKPVVVSPLNYTGGKGRLLPQILPLFPTEMESAVDLFAGGCTVGVNLPTSKVYFNDNNSVIKGIMETFVSLSKTHIFDSIHSIISRFGLSMTSTHGYEFYNCNSQDGLAPYNKEGFLKLRRYVNALKTRDSKYYLHLYTLIVYAFNNQIRFNRKGEYNLPVGKRDFNKQMQEKLSLYIDTIQSNDYHFSSLDFRQFPVENLSPQSFIYVDPPYLITTAGYNENGGWTEDDETDLHQLLDSVDKRGIRFAFSNVLEAKGKKNNLLASWLNNRDYIVHELNYSYANANYQRKNQGKSREVLITNYSV